MSLRSPFPSMNNLGKGPESYLVNEFGKPLEQWTPLGALDLSERDFYNDEDNLSVSSNSKLKNIMVEQEVLNNSLLSLTSHFAQVQFRLEQVLHADPELKESLLKELEQFAWKGIPDLHFPKRSHQTSEKENDMQSDSGELDQRKYVCLIIEQLKTQLNDLERFAYKNGEIRNPPTQCVLESQKNLLEEVGQRLGLNLPELHSLSKADIKGHIDAAILQLTSPMKTKEALVDQLKTQINDLERFIDFLHDDESLDSTVIKALQAFKSYQEQQLSSVQFPTELENSTPMKGTSPDDESERPIGFHIGLSRRRQSSSGPTTEIGSKQNTFSLITRAVAVLYAFAFCRSSANREKPIAKVNMKGHQSWSKEAQLAKIRHWGGLRARLESAIAIVLEKTQQLSLLQQTKDRPVEAVENEIKSATVDHPPGAPIAFITCSQPTVANSYEKKPGLFESTDEIIKAENLLQDNISKARRDVRLAVRKQLCPALESLIEHGIRTVSAINGARISNTGLFSKWSLGCFSRRSALTSAFYNQDSSPDEDEDDETQLSRRSTSSTAWSIFLKYYIMKNGRAFNDTPARKLSQSFALDIIGGKVITSSQFLLSSIGTILQVFNRYKRSDECQFRALVCMALNSNKLVSWLKLVLRNPLIVQHMYHPWSYVASTGFDDALQSLNKLTSVNFNIPFDTNVRHLQDIQDVY